MLNLFVLILDYSYFRPQLIILLLLTYIVVFYNSTNMNNNNTYEMNAIEGHFTNENNVPSNIDTNMNTGCEINTATLGDSSNAGGGDIAVDGGSF